MGDYMKPANRKPSVKKRPSGKIPERRDPPRACHCAGHRAILVFGAASDPTIHAALEWTLRQPNVHHKAHYTRAAGDTPHIPNAAATGWDGLRTASGKVGKTDDLGSLATDCCFYEEILVMAHGSHPGLNQFLASTLGQFIQTRPVRKLTVWTCETASDIYPGAGSNRHYYEKICGLLIPKACPCNCDLSLCDGRCHDPAGATHAGYRCPSVAETAKLYLAAWEDVKVAGKTKHIATKLGINPAAPGGRVFTSPDGRLREVTINADGSTSMTLVTGASVFAGITVQPDPGLSHPKPAKANGINADWRNAAATARVPVALHGYTGPTSEACPNRQGCMPG